MVYRRELSVHVVQKRAKYTWCVEESSVYMVYRRELNVHGAQKRAKCTWCTV